MLSSVLKIIFLLRIHEPQYAKGYFSGFGGRGGGGNRNDLSFFSRFAENNPLPFSYLVASSATPKRKKTLFQKLLQRNKKSSVQNMEAPPVIKSIKIVNSTLIPSSLISYATTRSKILGDSANDNSDIMTKIQAFSKYIRDWYMQHGYILNSISNAHISAEGECSFTVQEYRVSDEIPLEFIYVKPMIYDNATDSFLTLKQYQQKFASAKEFSKREDFPNVTFVEQSQTQAAARARPISKKWLKAMKITPGSFFVWDDVNYQKLQATHLRSIFRTILQIKPTLLEDGTVSLQITVEENPTKSLEYGLAKSLYTGAWEGEVNFQHTNLLGAGEKFGLLYQRAPTKQQNANSWRVFYKDDVLGCGNAFNVAVFNDYIQSPHNKAKEEEADKIQEETQDKEQPLVRRGLSYQLFPYKNKMTSQVKLNAEKVYKEEENQNEFIISSQIASGPYYFSLAEKLKHSLTINLNNGVRFISLDQDEKKTPYSIMTFTLKNMFLMHKATTLALQQKITTYLNEIPLHERNSIFYSIPIRGIQLNPSSYCSHTTISPQDKPLFLSGINEVRFSQIYLSLKEYKFEFSPLLFHDWFVYENNWNSCIGMGIRKSIQGIPIKYDLSYDIANGKFHNCFGIGRDFDL